MAPTIKNDNEGTFRVFFQDGSTTELIADTLLEPDNAKEDTLKYVFKRGEQVVGKYLQSSVRGWQLVTKN